MNVPADEELNDPEEVAEELEVLEELKEDEVAV